jgi:PPK2 family polyphosphate:nucleotide phosphotransferase
MKDGIKHMSTKAPDGINKKEAKNELNQLQKKFFRLHNLMSAESKHAILVILQGLDAAGKDGTVKHVFSHVNPADCVVTSFKAPTAEEKKHDWMWRIYPHFPEKGILQIHNRSYYEDVIVPSVNKQIKDEDMQHRMEFINAIEKHLTLNDITILKFYLHISPEEEKKRLDKRKKDPARHWKYDPADKNTEKHFSKFIDVYNEIIKKCADPVPWHIVPADDKWYRNYYISKTLVETLEGFNMKYPLVNPDI